ncbi:kyphoscoliosis peptidase-like [Rhopilema esculentum]|uniref:kyphoscoliosis peptidase-like n=1 Tax=Rhopilema esculentum TaxID=499914 RepID=UPI0031E2B5D3
MGCTSSKVQTVTVTANNATRKDPVKEKRDSGAVDPNNNAGGTATVSFDRPNEKPIVSEVNSVPKSSPVSEEIRFAHKIQSQPASNDNVDKENNNENSVEEEKERQTSPEIADRSCAVDTENDNDLSVIAITEAESGLLSSRTKEEDGLSNAPSNNITKRNLKSQLFSTLDVFKDIDAYALKAPRDSMSSFEELARYLTGQYDSDLFKARSIWIWVTSNISYDTDAFFNNDLSEAADETNALKTGKAVCSGYSSLVSALCRVLSAEKLLWSQSKEIHGFAKGYNYEIGQKFDGKKTNHSWTSIKIQGQWWLFDFTWGAGYVGNDKKFAWNYTEHYFMTDPELFILDHFPVDSEWQLMKPIYAIEEFEQWAKFSKHFFINQLKPVSHKNGIIEANDGNVEVVIGTVNPMQTSVKLEFIGKEQIKILTDYSFAQTRDAEIAFSARLPEVGKYNFKLFASKLTKDSVKSYDLVASYQINCKIADKNCMPFPKTFSSWQPGYLLHQPRNGILPSGESIPFEITAPDVIEMHISASGGKGEWISLKKSEKGFWVGNVTFSAETSAATVVVKIDGQTSTTFSGILKYVVES